jgi:hypothetical protein
MGQRRQNATTDLASAVLRAWAAITDACRTMIADQSRSYRPEQYYMRGPGPKWHEKHARWRDS